MAYGSPTAYVSAIDTNGLSKLEKIKWSRKILKIIAPTLVMQQLASEPDILQNGDGLTLRFTRQLPHGQALGSWTAITSMVAESGEVNIPLFTQFDVVVAVRGNHQTFDLYDTRAAFTSYVSAAMESYGNWYKEELDYELTKLVSQYCYLMRADGDATYEKDSVTTAHATSKTVVRAASLLEADDFWNGGIITYTSGPNIGWSGIISDFVDVNSVITHTSAPALSTAAGGDCFHICVTTGLTTGNKITGDAIRKAVRALENNRAPKYDGGNYVGILDPYAKYDFIGALVTTAQYTEKGIKVLFSNEVGIAYGVRWLFANKVYRADAALYAENVAGSVRTLLIMGKGAFGELKINRGNKPKLTLQAPLKGSTDPHEMKGMLGVSVAHAPTMLNALNVVGITHVPTA